MSSYVPVALRRLVSQRARGLCEYCLIDETDTFFGCEVEHIIAEKHGGTTTADNLAMACLFCNRFKGSDIASCRGARANSVVYSIHVRIVGPNTLRLSEQESNR